jgi:hypothetical protein
MFEDLKELRKPGNVELFYARGGIVMPHSIDALFALFARLRPTPPQLAGRTTTVRPCTVSPSKDYIKDKTRSRASTSPFILRSFTISAAFSGKPDLLSSSPMIESSSPLAISLSSPADLCVLAATSPGFAPINSTLEVDECILPMCKARLSLRPNPLRCLLQVTIGQVKVGLE